MRPCCLLLIACLLAACDTAGDKAEKASPLAYFAADAPFVVRLAPGSALPFLPLDAPALLDTLGLRPADLEAVFAALPGLDDAPEGGAPVGGEIVVRTALDGAALAARLKARAGAGTAYENATLYPLGDAAAAVRGADVLAAPSRGAVQAMIRRAGGPPNLAADANAVRLVGHLDAYPGGLYTRNVALLMSFFATTDTLLALLPNVLQVERGALALEPDVMGSPRATLWLYAPPPASAARSKALLDAFVNLARASTTDPETIALLASLQSAPDGADLRVSFTLPAGVRPLPLPTF